MYEWNYEKDLLLLKDSSKVEWPKNCPREKYVEFYRDNSCEPDLYKYGWEPLRHLKIELDENGDPLPEYDPLLVRRCNMVWNIKLCDITTYPDDIILDWNGNLYEANGHLFPLTAVMAGTITTIDARADQRSI